MLESRKAISIGEAVKKLMMYQMKGMKEWISIDESYGRYLAEDITATHDVPYFTKSLYDGYAIRSIDIVESSGERVKELEVIESVPAGAVPSYRVGEKQATRIMTGAQLPDGADAVVMLEEVKEIERNAKKYILVKSKVNQGQNISPKGEDAKYGETIVKKGTKINPGIKAVLATFGYNEVPVAKKPVIGLFATGTELLDVNQKLEPGKIRNSNSYMMIDQIKRAGGEAKFFGVLPDEFDTCYEALAKAIDEVDLIITTGGVSVGDFDYMPDLYKKLGAEVLFNKVAMRPGSVTTIAVKGNTIFFGLSGNPSASYVGFELFVRPIIKSMLFCDLPHLRKERAILDANFPQSNPFMRLVRGLVYYEEGQVKVMPSGKDQSNIVMSLASANSLIMLPGGATGYVKGETVDVLLLEDFKGSKWPYNKN